MSVEVLLRIILVEASVNHNKFQTISALFETPFHFHELKMMYRQLKFYLVLYLS
jgi:hypothetical protein